MKARYSTITACTVALVLVAVSLLGMTVAADTTTLDDDTALTHESQIEQFKDEGVATADVTVPHMTITVATESEDVGLDGIRYTDFDTTYLRIEYRESIPRTVRIYVPDDYWYPHPDEIDSESSDSTAAMEPTSSGDYSAVTVHFEGETDAVFGIRKQASMVFSARNQSTRFISNETGIDLPQVDGRQDQWEYVPTSDLNESTFAIDSEGGDLAVQYDRANTTDPSEQRWRTVPDCSTTMGSRAPVCEYEDRSTPDAANILIRDDNPPDIRYNRDTGVLTDVRAAVGELTDVPRDVYRDAKELVTGVLG